VTEPTGRRPLRAAAEVVLLFGALVFTLPYVPSNEIERLPLMPAGAFATVLFAGSRLLRWGRRGAPVAVVEVLVFIGFVVIANEVANIIYHTS
jgi:hypothetical protein